MSHNEDHITELHEYVNDYDGKNYYESKYSDPGAGYDIHYAEKYGSNLNDQPGNPFSDSENDDNYLDIIDFTTKYESQLEYDNKPNYKYIHLDIKEKKDFIKQNKNLLKELFCSVKNENLNIIITNNPHKPQIQYTLYNAKLKKDIESAHGTFYEGTEYMYFTFYLNNTEQHKNHIYVDWEMFEFNFKVANFEANLFHAIVGYITKYRYKFKPPVFDNNKLR